MSITVILTLDPLPLNLILTKFLTLGFWETFGQESMDIILYVCTTL